MNTLPLLRLVPQYRDYVWGGNRLRPGRLTAEAWVLHELDAVTSGPLQGSTLSALAAQFGEELLGSQGMARAGGRFPLLVKLLDVAQWLSVQVHPNDEQARRLEGPRFCGKTEAWHLLNVEPGARLLAGIRPGTVRPALEEAIRSEAIVPLMSEQIVQAGDTLFIPPGTLHALGPGLLVYEVQQSSDLTYRVFDWNRPHTAGRRLHLEQALAVADPAAGVTPRPLPELRDGESAMLAECAYFSLQMLCTEKKALDEDTQGESFHALTVIAGQAVVHWGEQNQRLEQYETLLVPAGCGEYRVQPMSHCRILKAFCK